MRIVISLRLGVAHRNYIAVRCCLQDAEHTEAIAVPGQRFCSKCENVRRKPQLKTKAKKLCECFQHKTQRCGPDSTTVDKRCPPLNLCTPAVA